MTEGDLVTVGGFTAAIRKIEEIAPKTLFIDTTKAPRASSNSRGNICFIESTVCLHGKTFIVPWDNYESFHSVKIKFDKKKNTLDIHAHSLNVNASGYLTTDGIV